MSIKLTEAEKTQLTNKRKEFAEFLKRNISFLRGYHNAHYNTYNQRLSDNSLTLLNIEAAIKHLRDLGCK